MCADRFKKQYKDKAMRAIINLALATYPWQCRGSGDLPLAEPPLFADAKTHFSKNQKKYNKIFFDTLFLDGSVQFILIFK